MVKYTLRSITLNVCHAVKIQSNNVFRISSRTQIIENIKEMPLVDIPHHITTGLRPFFRDYPGELVPEQNF